MSDASSEKTGFRLLRMWFWSYVATGVLWVGIRSYQEHQERVERQRALERDIQKIQEAVDRGEGGEAFRRIFGGEHEQPE